MPAMLEHLARSLALSARGCLPSDAPAPYGGIGYTSGVCVNQRRASSPLCAERREGVAERASEQARAAWRLLAGIGKAYGRQQSLRGVASKNWTRPGLRPTGERTRWADFDEQGTDNKKQEL